jgi:hypothetical protein
MELLEEDLETEWLIDARTGLAHRDRICPCLRDEVALCGDLFLRSFACAMRYRRDYEKTDVACMLAHEQYLECRETLDELAKPDPRQ